MQQRLMTFLRLDRYTDPLEQRQAIAAYVVIISAIAAVGVGVFADPTYSLQEPWAVFSTILFAAIVVLLLLLWSGRLIMARVGSIVVSFLSLSYPLVTQDLSSTAVLITVMFLIITTLMAGPRMVLASAIVVVLRDFSLLFTLPENVISLSDVLTSVSFYVMFGVLFFLLAQGLRSSAEILVQRTEQRRVQLVELSSEVAQRISQRMALETLFTQTVETIRDRFDEIYHAQVFLIDPEAQDAVLKASTGRAGEQLLAIGHKLGVGSQSVIGQVTLMGEPVLAQSGPDSVHRPNEYLPDTRTELALPLIAGDRVIGALDVQSMESYAFTEDHINVLQTLANQIAVAIDNATLFAEQQAFIEENERLVAQARAQVAQIQDLNRRLTRQAWGQYLERQELTPALTVDFVSNSVTPNAEWTPGMAGAVATPESTLPKSETPTLAVPVMVRGLSVGAMEFELEEGAELEVEQVALMQEVASRLALSLESSRLYDEAQRLALREALINDIGARLQTVSGTQNVLAAAAQGLQSALQASRVAIRLGALQETPNSAPAGEEGA